MVIKYSFFSTDSANIEDQPTKIIFYHKEKV